MPNETQHPLQGGHERWEHIARELGDYDMTDTGFPYNPHRDLERVKDEHYVGDWVRAEDACKRIAKLEQAEALLDRISKHPSVAEYAGVGDGSVADAVVGLAGGKTAALDRERQLHEELGARGNKLGAANRELSNLRQGVRALLLAAMKGDAHEAEQRWRELEQALGESPVLVVPLDANTPPECAAAAGTMRRPPHAEGCRCTFQFPDDREMVEGLDEPVARHPSARISELVKAPPSSGSSHIVTIGKPGTYCLSVFPSGGWQLSLVETQQEAAGRPGGAEVSEVAHPEAEPLCARCGLPADVHGHGEGGTREAALPPELRASHPFEPAD